MGRRPVPRQHLRQPIQKDQNSHENAEVAAVDAFAIAAGAKSRIFASVNYAVRPPQGDPNDNLTIETPGYPRFDRSSAVHKPR